MNMRWVMALIGLATLADQLTKAAALSLLSRGEVVPVLPGFNLTLGFNEGASFGMLSGRILQVRKAYFIPEVARPGLYRFYYGVKEHGGDVCDYEIVLFEVGTSRR